jgi:uncharacterized hydrophobic protein (TIGR00341 family)
MALRRIEVLAEERYADRISSIAERFNALEYWSLPAEEEGRRLFYLLLGRCDRQELLDALQNAVGNSDGSRVMVTAVEATIPSEDEEESEEEAAERKRENREATREEIYTQVAHGADLNYNYILQTMLSTVVASIGLIEGNIAVVIGAMVIAPLLGPNLAFSFGVALGDGKMMLRAILTGMAGLGAALVLAAGIGLLGHFPLDSPELLSRTRVGFDGIALALASGAAAVLSITAGLPTALVGVMVAVALLPPAAAAGIMLGAREYYNASGAMLLLIVNIVSVNLAAVLVFRTQGIKPRTWLEQRSARQSVLVSLAVWTMLLIVMGVVIFFRKPV